MKDVAVRIFVFLLSGLILFYLRLKCAKIMKILKLVEKDVFSSFATPHLIELIVRFRCSADLCPEDACIPTSGIQIDKNYMSMLETTSQYCGEMTVASLLLPLRDSELQELIAKDGAVS